MSGKLFVKLSYVLVAFCLVGTLCSCSDDDKAEVENEEEPDEPDEPESVTPKISVSTKSLTFASVGGSENVTVTASGAWSVEGSDWLTISPSSGTGDCEVEVTAVGNVGKETSDRSENLKFSLDSGERSTSISVTQYHDDGIVRILAIGNSFTEDSVEQYLWELFDAAGIEAVIGHLCIGSCDLETHYYNARGDVRAYSYRKIVDGVKTTTSDYQMSTAMQQEDWDYICFHQRTNYSAMYDTYFPYLTYLMDYARKNCSNNELKLALHLPWAYPYGSSSLNCGQLEMYYLLVDTVHLVADEVGMDIVIPAGTAVQNARNTYLGNTLNRDTQHLEYTYGRYTSSCAWFEALSGVDVTTTTYAPDGVDENLKDLVNHAAHYAVLNPREINPMTEWQVAP